MIIKNKYSFLAFSAISIVLILVRLIYADIGSSPPIKVTTWDALGYYMYLPSKYIYQDEKELKWFHKIDSIYAVSGGELYQATKHKSGNYVFKYLKGVSHLQLPFFALAHFYAQHSGYPADGFSKPYQYSIAFGCLFYCLIAIFLLRKILLRYFDDITTAITLVLLTLASNFIQYVAIEGGQSHGYIFPLYVFILYATIQWHLKPKLIWALLIGLIIGVATTCRPTEAVMIFIPLFWNTHSKELLKDKIDFFRKNYMHLLLVISGMFMGILPQLLYWKRVTGSWVYDVGSKWDFLSPHFRVLFGWEKGWFIYTPVAILFIIGIFLMKKTEYRKPVILFCVLNIYIIISWHIWRYGGSYSCRALVQSYPLFAFPLAAFVEYSLSVRLKLLFVFIFIYLVAVNLFQIKQYNENVIHYDDMNFKYYKAIYFDSSPDALDMSLLDTDEIIRDESKYKIKKIYQNLIPETLCGNDTLWIKNEKDGLDQSKERWLKFKLVLHPETSTWGMYLTCIVNQKTEKRVKIRLFNALSELSEEKTYEFFVKIPEKLPVQSACLILEGPDNFRTELKDMSVFELEK